MFQPVALSARSRFELFSRFSMQNISFNSFCKLELTSPHGRDYLNEPMQQFAFTRGVGATYLLNVPSERVFKV